MRYYDAFGISARQLAWLKDGKGSPPVRYVLTLKPRERLPGVEKIVILYCNDAIAMAKALRESGMTLPEMTVVPRSPEDN